MRGHHFRVGLSIFKQNEGKVLTLDHENELDSAIPNKTNIHIVRALKRRANTRNVTELLNLLTNSEMAYCKNVFNHFSILEALTRKMKQGSVFSVGSKVSFLIWPPRTPTIEYQQYCIIRDLSVLLFPGLQVTRHQLVINVLRWKQNKKKIDRTLGKSNMRCSLCLMTANVR